ncbi:MAG: universal stress protein [Kouleothrix sp.]
MLRSIMVPLDGSAFGDMLPLALGIARRRHCRTPSACVRATQAKPLSQPAGRHGPRGRTPTRARLPRQPRRLPHGSWDVQIKTAIVDGPAETALRHYALEHKCDLVVLSTHGYGPLSRMWLGSVARALALTLPMPLLLTRPHGEPVDLLESVTQQPFQRVLVPLDGSPLAEQALEPALALGQLVGAEYTLLQVIGAAGAGLRTGRVRSRARSARARPVARDRRGIPWRGG